MLEILLVVIGVFYQVFAAFIVCLYEVFRFFCSVIRIKFESYDKASANQKLWGLFFYFVITVTVFFVINM